jgi:hypothetical protein
MSDTPRNRRRAAEVLSVAFPDLTEKEVRRLLSKAQAVKRDEIWKVEAERTRGAGLKITGAVKG